MFRSPFQRRFPWLYLHDFEARRLEWCIAIITALVGVASVAPNTMTLRPEVFYDMLRVMDETTWGVFYLLAGIYHLTVLQSDNRGLVPAARAIALFINSQAYLSVALSLLSVNPTSIGVIVFGGIALIMCGVAFHTTILDCKREWLIYKAKKECSRGR